MLLYKKEIDVARSLAVEAGAVVMEIYQRDFISEEKDHNAGPVTEADFAANKVILDGLKKAFPGDALCSEETSDDLSRLEAGRVWSVDPIDGTKEFIAKNGEFAIHIGLIVEGRPVIGVVAMPAHEKIFFGGPSMGAFCEYQGRECPLKTRSVADFSRMILVGSRSHRDEDYQSLLECLELKEEIVFGSIGGKVALIVQQEADIFIHPNPYTHEWDICAPEAILLGAGGQVTDILGGPLRYNQKNLRNMYGLLASNGANHADVVARVHAVLRKRDVPFLRGVL